MLKDDNQGALMMLAATTGIFLNEPSQSTVCRPRFQYTWNLELGTWNYLLYLSEDVDYIPIPYISDLNYQVRPPVPGTRCHILY